jgi:hypothetical protein
LYKSSADSLDGYRGFVVEPVIVDLTRPPARVIEDLREYIELSVSKVILSEYDIFDQPGENIAVIRTRLSYVSDESPIKVNPDAEDIDGPCLEVEISDSLTEQTLVSMALRRPQINVEGLTKWNKAKLTIEHWAQNLAVVLLCRENEPCKAANQFDASSPDSLTDQ